ncbi:MAG: hypothetical protein LH609_11695 [Rudanella sp.]|nr:hypothetical protein [Rudanella sp.]
MKNFVTIRLFKAFDKVSYYTFWVEGRPQSETDAFFARFETNQSVAHDLNVLVAWISEIGLHRGAKARYFRFENDANALPPPARIMAELGDDYCRLRLYCVRLSDEVVLLANGGLKTGRTVQDSPDLLAKFRFANKMADQLVELIASGELQMAGKEIVNMDGLELLD